MKNIALIATTLALLSAGANAQEKQMPSQTQTVEVTVVGSGVAFYTLPSSNGTMDAMGGKITYDSKSQIITLEDSATIEWGKYLVIRADKVILKTDDDGQVSVTLYGSGKVESAAGVSTKFVAAK